MSESVVQKNSVALADQAARDRICNDLDTTLIVEAAAGTGKTSALIGRILSGIVNDRVSLSKMVAVTFTEFAAGELKLRLRSEIERARQENSSPQTAKLLEQAVEQLDEARIGTIHSFCADLLREHPVEAGIDPLFEVSPDDLTHPLFEVAFERWFERQLANPSDAVRRILRRPPRREFAGKLTATLARRPRESGPKPILRAAARKLIEERDFTAPWSKPERFDRESEIDALILEMKDLGEWSEKGDRSAYFTKSLIFLKSFVADVTRVESLGEPRDYDGIEARLFGFLPAWKSKNYRAYYARDDFPKDDLLRRRDELKGRVEKFVAAVGAELAPRLRDELVEVVEDFEKLKERAGYLDFLDLLLRARNLIRDHREIRVELQRRIKHIFVDEFQDTDPLQAEILMLLSADDPEERDWRQAHPVSGKLFIVGDPKQSIYRFRRADVALYQEVKRKVISSGGALVDLNVSFRSSPELQQLVNAAFAPVMAEESLTQAKYVPLAPYRKGVSTQPAVVALPVAQPYGDFGKVVDWKIDQSLPEQVAAFVNWLVNDSGWTVTERGRSEERVPLQARHVCLLFRRLRHYATDVTRAYVQELEAHRIPHLLVGGSSFHSREEVEAIRNALTAIEWPDDELSMFATLKGPLFAFSDAELLSYRSKCGTFHPFKQPPADLPESLHEIVEALGTIRGLHLQRNLRPIAETIQSLLGQTRAHAGFANWSTGEQALANINRLNDMARRVERNGLISFRAFVNWLDEQAESGDVGDAPIMEEGVDGVRIMTVHKAKGLEFPVVIMCDITAKDSRDPSKWVDQAAGLSAIQLAGCTPIEVQDHWDDEVRIEKEEAARILYVAATRARDLLVVCAVGDEPYDGWLGTLNPVIYPPETNSFKPLTRQPVGCPLFGLDTVPVRPEKAFRRPGSVSPGLHEPQAGKHVVVWWDPSVLPQSIQGRTSTRLTDFLKQDDGKLQSEKGIRAHQEWQTERAMTRAAAARSEVSIVTVTDYAEAIASRALTPAVDPDGTRAAMPEVELQEIEIDFPRPQGKRFGMLVHAIMAIVPLNSTRAAINDVALLQGRVLGASEEELAAAIETVDRALRHPLIKRAATAAIKGECRREVPVALRLDDTSVVEGVADLAFRDEDSTQKWTVVDYKTDFEIAGRLDEYKTQLGIYSLAISSATGHPSFAILLKI